ncbi:hypothetical protein E3AUHO_48100 [Klebsiella pneumoniae subsp. pneumoniae]|nr:hypothetical protein E3AUHO_48100 [Klebsiella pneumoniae subsp. pneumoniae]
MNTVKKLPLAMAVVAALCPISVMAQEFTQEQIDAIVAKAVDKALADRQAKIDAAADKKVDVITNPETTAASPDMAIPFGLKFSGYARYGAHFQTGDQKLRRALALCREVAYITLSSFRVNPFFRIFLCNRTGCLCEVIHICRVSGCAL